MALKPVLTAWLEEAEKAYKTKQMNSAFLPNSDKKRKRTSIGAAEKRSLEAYFAMNPRPSSDKIASIAEKLDLSKNVVRVWFCNQRQKKKRMKFSVHWWTQEFKNFVKNITSIGYALSVLMSNYIDSNCYTSHIWLKILIRNLFSWTKTGIIDVELSSCFRNWWWSEDFHLASERFSKKTRWKRAIQHDTRLGYYLYWNCFE